MKCAVTTGSSFPLPQPQGVGVVASSDGFAGAIDALLATVAPEGASAPVSVPMASMTPQLVAQAATWDGASTEAGRAPAAKFAYADASGNSSLAATAATRDLLCAGGAAAISMDRACAPDLPPATAQIATSDHEPAAPALVPAAAKSDVMSTAPAPLRAIVRDGEPAALTASPPTNVATVAAIQAPSPDVLAAQVVAKAEPTPSSARRADKTVSQKGSPPREQPSMIGSQSNAEPSLVSFEVPSAISRGDGLSAAGQRPTAGKRPRNETAASPTQATPGASAGDSTARDVSLMAAAFVVDRVPQGASSPSDPAMAAAASLLAAADATVAQSAAPAVASPVPAGTKQVALNASATVSPAMGGAHQERGNPAVGSELADGASSESFQLPTTDAVAMTPEVKAAKATPVEAAMPDVNSAPVALAATAAPAVPVQVVRALPSSVPEPRVAARVGQIGHEVGVAIARRVSAGGDELVVRLMPAEFGRIEVRMAFDERGGLRAVIAADSPAALDMLRRDSADLSRALTDAGVRSDANSLNFQTDGGSQSGSGQSRSPWLDAGRKLARAADDVPFADDGEPLPYRQVRTSGRYDLMA
ncbi:flagellar hook-length control protein FliK, putative [Novosphingobium sp. Rr 2-17]|uniref:flagellar hook-length control protein FliK n=1 Tax=Novosphingobium sp. Rr 2-17 TaxID=555793 RepID=UPI000269953D|nr:flagellar hook-length control protein FliK [Novosphingobium sp. Rr 2-17]EIZ78728.1 flagellar hook-length control protein FliK, putative [Novosphingobium sp. Rr 2-17]